MGGVVCAKLLLCSPPVAEQFNMIADFAGRYLRGELGDVALNEYHLKHALEEIEAGEKNAAKAMKHMVDALGGY